MAETSPKIDGWKSKYGGIAMAIGTAIMAGSEVAPSPEIKKWLIFLGVLITGGGASLLGIGISHKIQKTGVAK